MFTVHPKEIERYALRTLLLYRKGCGSFEALRTVDGVIYSTFRETCEKLILWKNMNSYWLFGM